MRNPRSLAFLLLWLTLIPGPAFGWNQAGHRLVAEIARRALTPRARARADRLLAVAMPEDAELRLQSHDFVSAACWADDIKRFDRAYNALHFIDVPYSVDGTPVPAMPVRIPNLLNGLVDNVAVLRDPHRSEVERARALRFVLHFVGDAHQPLHCIDGISRAHPRGDRGGNEFHVRVVRSLRPLHFLWDDGVGLFQRIQRRDYSSIRKLADAIAGARVTPLPVKGTRAEFTRWVRESHDLAPQVYGGLRAGAALPDGYVARGQRIVRERVLLAGRRLAGLLNALLTR